MAKILIVDDERSIRFVLCEYLLYAGHEVSAAEDADQALDMLANESFDVVMTDIVLPRVTGIELLRHLHALECRPQVIVMTGEPTLDTAAEAVREGAFDYLTKPVSEQTVCRAVDRAAHVKRLDDERARLQKENLEHRENLENLVEERTRALREREAQLRHSQRLEGIGQLAAGVAHEINNPINGIMNYAQLIKDLTVTQGGEVPMFADEIIHESERITALVRSLLQFGRAEQTQSRETHIGDTLRGTLLLIKAMMRRDQIEFETNVPDDLPVIHCASQQIQQILMNLMTNARDALNERYPTRDDNKIIRISAGVLNVSGRSLLRLTVEDHGPGIPEEARERIFGAFYTSKDEAKGTGLGLSISRAIARQHGGELRVESKVGEWTRFHLDLPLPGDG